MLRSLVTALGVLLVSTILYKIAEFIGNRVFHFSDVLKELAAFFREHRGKVNQKINCAHRVFCGARRLYWFKYSSSACILPPASQ